MQQVLCSLGAPSGASDLDRLWPLLCGVHRRTSAALPLPMQRTPKQAQSTLKCSPGCQQETEALWLLTWQAGSATAPEESLGADLL